MSPMNPKLTHEENVHMETQPGEGLGAGGGTPVSHLETVKDQRRFTPAPLH